MAVGNWRRGGFISNASMVMTLCLMVSFFKYAKEIHKMTTGALTTTGATLSDIVMGNDLSSQSLPEIEPILSNDVHWNVTDDGRSPPSIYMCVPDLKQGRGEIQSVFRSILPEYEVVNLRQIIGEDKTKKKDPDEHSRWTKLQHVRSSNSYDVLILTVGGMCNNDEINTWLFYAFKGRIVVHSPESYVIYPSKFNDNIHYFGPIADERPGKDMILTYLQTTWHYKFKEEFPTTFMTDPALRPRSDKTHFMVYSHSNCVKIREETAGKLSQIGQLHYGGKCKGIANDRTNLTKVNKNIGIRNWSKNTELNTHYRFCLVMEHTTQLASYITEKILMAFIAGCIPVYSGPDLIFDFFNRNAFVFYNISNPQPSLDQVRELESDAVKYNEMLAQPIAANGEKSIEKYFSFDGDVGGGVLKEKIRKMLGLENLVP